MARGVVSRSWFPDLIGPSKVAANGGAGVSIRKRVLQILSAGVTAADNQAAKRIDVTVPDPAWSQIDAPTSTAGEWLPANVDFGSVFMVRVTSSVSGTVMTGLDSTTDPTQLIKYVANYGTNTITLAPPASPIAGKQYFGSTYPLTANSTVRVAWDTVAKVYRIRGAPIVTDYIVLGASPLSLDGDRLLNPS